ncbi:ubiquitin-like small modifier protein 1 [Thermococcus barophilus]|uniref:Molybdopterin converting factor n=1 Tax=Thermococcus barophilus (strain DSM 11836 / MP) TaxID=391623 RepID=F0LKQ9_THEBM|nr:ubiquitin-like small modifier protein 1 [Thermococcus barophilus]ADT83638.1 molybdopterin converting factor [Thermococcus barophilus MP]
MKVKFYATLRDLTGKKEIEIKGVKTVKELLDTLDKMFPGIKKELIDEDGDVNGMILVNGHNIVHLKLWDTELKEEDVVHIFPPAGGG